MFRMSSGTCDLLSSNIALGGCFMEASRTWRNWTELDARLLHARHPPVGVWTLLVGSSISGVAESCAVSWKVLTVRIDPLRRTWTRAVAHAPVSRSLTCILGGANERPDAVISSVTRASAFFFFCFFSCFFENFSCCVVGPGRDIFSCSHVQSTELCGGPVVRLCEVSDSCYYLLGIGDQLAIFFPRSYNHSKGPFVAMLMRCSSFVPCSHRKMPILDLDSGEVP
ncbi:hypothetical protein BDZ97DRAFT_800889 [Flammula alnicola]|nr:hypothetical protein BDZ97DRAFT_800889 [Flammula alnicola]